MAEGTHGGRHGRRMKRRVWMALVMGVVIGAAAASAGWSSVHAVKPLVQQAKLTGRGEVGQGAFEYRVAVSSDGNTALVGAPNDHGEVGAAWVFIRSGSKWRQAGSKLTGRGEIGNGLFGYSVALSADGNTALVGGVNDREQTGAAWVFTRTNGAWRQQGTKLTGRGEVGKGGFGESVALWANGKTALISGRFDNERLGAAWAFTRTGATWRQQGAKLVPRAEHGRVDFGQSVALSTDGNTALIGGYGVDGFTGGAWIFTRAGGTWRHQGDRLTGRGVRPSSVFGYSVALSGDGNTALISGAGDNDKVGAAWMFSRTGTDWRPQGSKLTARGEIGPAAIGYGVALSAAADTALVGGIFDNDTAGAVWVLTRP